MPELLKLSCLMMIHIVCILLSCAAEDRVPAKMVVVVVNPIAAGCCCLTLKALIAP